MNDSLATQDGRERRRAPRIEPSAMGVEPAGTIRPRIDVQIVNISQGGVLLESSARLRPGFARELILSAGEQQFTVSGQVLRSWVAQLSPLRYRSVLAFEEVDFAALRSHALTQGAQSIKIDLAAFA